MFRRKGVIGILGVEGWMWGQVRPTVLYSVTTIRTEPVDINYDADISVGIDARSSAILRRAEASASDGVLHVRAFEGLKTELKNTSKRGRDSRTGRVEYYDEHHPQAIVNGTLSLNAARANSTCTESP